MEWAWPAFGILLGFVCVLAAVSGYALHLALKAIIEVKALQNSTHSVQMVPVNEAAAAAEAEAPGSEEELNKILDKQDDRFFRDMDEIHQTSEALM